MKWYEGNRSHLGLCAAVLAIALFLRMATSAQAQELVRDAAENPVTAAAIMRISLGGSTAPVTCGQAQSDDAQAVLAEVEAEPEPEPEPAPAPETEVPPLTFSQEEADGIVLFGTCTQNPDPAELLLERGLQLDFSRDGPQVLIIHTHATEAYTPEPGWEYEQTDALRTEDPAYNVVRVGTALAQELEALGIGVVHDTGIRDYPTYNGSYTRTLTAIETQLAEHPSIRIVIDLHRDAAENPDGTPVAVTTQLNGEAAAQLMFVVGTDEGGLQHPNWQENLALVVRLQALLRREEPTLCRAVNLRTERFNQHASFGSLLVEVGASGNTLAEALRSMPYLAKAVAAVITDCQSAKSPRLAEPTGGLVVDYGMITA